MNKEKFKQQVEKAINQPKGKENILTSLPPLFEKLFLDWDKTVKRIFPLSVGVSSLKHLRREIKEAESEYELATKSDRLWKVQKHYEALTEELADCFLCLMTACSKSGIRLEELTQALYKKIEKNKNRKWRFNGDGTYSHINPEDLCLCGEKHSQDCLDHCIKLH